MVDEGRNTGYMNNNIFTQGNIHVAAIYKQLSYDRDSTLSLFCIYCFVWYKGSTAE